MLGAPLYGFGAERPGNPHRRMWLLVWQRPRIDVAIVKMFSLVPPRPRSRPCLYDEVVRFIEHLAIVGGVSVVEELFATGAANPSSDETAARDQIDLSQFLGHPQRMFDHWQRVTDEHQTHALGAIG